MGRVLADTNVWLRIADPGAAQHSVAIEAVARLMTSGSEVFICPQNLVEFWVVATRPVSVNGLGWTPDEAGAELDELESRFALLPETPVLFTEWKRIVQAGALCGKRAHDARIAAACHVHRLNALLTFNIADFAGCGPLNLLDPQSPDSWRID